MFIKNLGFVKSLLQFLSIARGLLPIGWPYNLLLKPLLKRGSAIFQVNRHKQDLSQAREYGQLDWLLYSLCWLEYRL